MELCKLCTEDKEREAGLVYSSFYWRVYGRISDGIYQCEAILKRHVTNPFHISNAEREDGHEMRSKLYTFPANTPYQVEKSVYHREPHLFLRVAFIEESDNSAHPCNPGIQLMSDTERLQLFKDRLKEHLSS